MTKFFQSHSSPCFYGISNFLFIGQFSPHLFSKEKCNNFKKRTPYSLIWGNLFRLGPDNIPRRCVREDDFYDILSASHD